MGNKQKDIALEFIQRKIHIAILSETKKKGNGSTNIKDFIHFYMGVDKHERAKPGLSILIHKRQVNLICVNIHLKFNSLQFV